jgi:hypothetical protein
MSYLEQQFADLWLSLYPATDLHSEYRFSPPRRYRWDFCHLESKVAIDRYFRFEIQSEPLLHRELGWEEYR